MLAVIDSKRRALRDDKENLDITNGTIPAEFLVFFAMVEWRPSTDMHLFTPNL
jgi:hypothetical protein